MERSTYWNKRALLRLTESEQLSKEGIKQIQSLYKQAYKNLNRDIQNIYKNYSMETGLDVQKLKTLLTKSQTDKVWKTLKKQGLDKYVLANYKARINRIEELQAQIYARIKQVNKLEQKALDLTFKGVINQSYYKTMYDTQMGTGYDFTFNLLDKKLENKIITHKWSDVMYTDRCWYNNDVLSNEIVEIIGGSILSGQSLTKTMKQIRERFDVEDYKIERLVRTETNYFHNQADMEAYKELGVDRYVCVATLDNRTSKFCIDIDNKDFAYRDIKVGKNFPPFHPNCRCKTRGYIEGYEETIKRRARNPFTNKPETIDKMSYKEWVKKLKDRYGKKETEALFPNLYNK